MLKLVPFGGIILLIFFLKDFISSFNQYGHYLNNFHVTSFLFLKI
ncbi:hypothetical protein [Gilliamella sp. wkB7]